MEVFFSAWLFWRKTEKIAAEDERESEKRGVSHLVQAGLDICLVFFFLVGFLYFKRFVFSLQ